MYLITNKEMKTIENIRKELCRTEESYVANSHLTIQLFKITHKRRNFKWLIKNIG